MRNDRALLLTALAGFIIFTPANAAPSCMTNDPKAWLDTDEQRSLYKRLGEYLTCPDHSDNGPLADRVACNYLAGKLLSDLHGIRDFARGNGGWLTANEIAAYVTRSGAGWGLIGSAEDQSALSTAATAATNGDAVIAVRTGTPGHVAVILPGKIRGSTKWDRQVPNSASFALDDVESAYVFCRLSFAFSSPQGVKLYRRQPQ